MQKSHKQHQKYYIASPPAAAFHLQLRNESESIKTEPSPLLAGTVISKELYNVYVRCHVSLLVYDYLLKE